jgi:putative flippase GtrA
MPTPQKTLSPHHKSAWIIRFRTFLLVGVLATLLHYFLLIALVQLTGTSAVVASSVGFTLSAVINYMLNRRYTFRSNRAHRLAFPRFAVAALLGLALNAAFVWCGHDVLRLHYLLAQMIATLLSLSFNYYINLLWTFVDQPAITPSGPLK